MFKLFVLKILRKYGRLPHVWKIIFFSDLEVTILQKNIIIKIYFLNTITKIKMSKKWSGSADAERKT